MSTILIGIGGLDATRSSGDSVKTMALGSCVALILLDPKTRAVGMAHIALPESTVDPEMAKRTPGYFADTALPALLKRMSELGASSQGSGFVIKLIGGANVMDSNNTFNIGKRNALAVKKLLWKFGLGVLAEETGGDISRTVEVFADTGVARITTPGRDMKEI
jgi:chemotaxis protein CheD